MTADPGGRDVHDLAGVDGLAGLDDLSAPVPAGHRSGMVALVGRPNVGKSSLLNAMVGAKVAIVTDVPGTTRSIVRGVLTREDAQLVFVDLPGMAKPRTLLGRRLNELVREGWSGVDVVAFVVDIAGGVGRGDEYLAAQVGGTATSVVVVANQEDRVTPKLELLPRLEQAGQLFPGADVVPTSALTGANVDRLVDVLTELLPEGPRLFPAGAVSDQPDRHLAGEIVREHLIGRLADEVPHGVAVTIETFRAAEHRDDLLEIDATIVVERDSQKGIIIGRGGSALRDASTRARQELEQLFGRRVYLGTHVKVAKDWQRDPKQLRRLGY